MSVRQRLQATFKSCSLTQRYHKTTGRSRVPAFTDAFTILAQQNLNRLLTQRLEKSATWQGFRLLHPRELGESQEQDYNEETTEPKTELALLKKRYTQLGDRRRLHLSSGDGGPFISFHISDHAQGVDAGPQKRSIGEGPGLRFIRPSEIARKETIQNASKNIGAQSEPSQQSIRQLLPVEGHIALDEDDVVLKDLEDVIDTFRNFQCAKSSTASSSAELVPYPEASPGLRTSHFSRLASQYYRKVAHLSEGSSSRPYSTQARGLGKQRFASSSASAVSHITSDPSVSRANAPLKPESDERHIRQHLKAWQYHHDTENHALPDGSPTLPNHLTTPQNPFTQSAEDESYSIVSQEDDMEDGTLPQADEDGTLSVINAPKWLKQGDLVEHSTLGEPILSIFIKDLEAGGTLFYTERGTWLFRMSRMSMFSVPSFVGPNDLKDILRFAPSEKTAETLMDKLQPMSIHAPRGAGTNVLDTMRRFRVASDSLYREHAERLNRGYDMLAPPTHLLGRRSVLLQDATMKILQKKSVSELTPVMLWTVHRTLNKMQNVLTDWRTHRINPEFIIFPKQNLEHLNRVKDWMREYQDITIEEKTVIHSKSFSTVKDGTPANPIASFAEKARTAILACRQTRQVSPTGYIGPSLNKVEPCKSDRAIWRVTPTDTLTFSDRVIIHYMDAWVAARHLNKHTDYPALGPMILRAVGLYENRELDESTGFTFLQELGIVSPWQNRWVYLTRAGLPGHDPSHPVTVARNKSQRQLVRTTPKDIMLAFRKDWGDLPVYCIDSAKTTERDDGISLEEINGDTWVHVHVSNPSAFISPGSAFARYAAMLSESVYLPDLKYPMLEPKLSEKYFSLGLDRPCITFSAKVGSDGAIIDHQISHGEVHNVRYLTSQRLSEDLGLDDGNVNRSTTLLTVGGLLPNIAKPAGQHSPYLDTPLTPADLQRLHKLRSIGEAMESRRVRNGALVIRESSNLWRKASLEIYFGQGVSDTPRPLSNNIQRFDGDPIISVKSSTEGARSVTVMVAQFMILAGEVCANWCLKRHLPVPYRGIRVNPQPPFSGFEFRRNVIDPQLEKQGFADEDDILKYLRALGAIECSASPLEHTLLGLPAYTQATSPLRRYSDLLTHWQIEAAIRHENETKTSVNRTNPPHLPFSYAEVEAAGKRIAARRRAISTITQGSVDHWYNQALFRAFYFREAWLPETFTVKIIIRGDYMKKATAYLLGWGRTVQLENRSPAVIHQGGYQVGDIWEARILKILLYDCRVAMEPIRLLFRGAGLCMSGK